MHIPKLQAFVLALAAGKHVTASPLAAPSLDARAASPSTATVALSSLMGKPSHIASGIIYGTPDKLNQIPASFYSGMGFNYGRAGGAQTPSKGWLASPAEYAPRFQSALSNYKTARQYGGRFQLLLHDLWGADTTQSSNAPYPGDNGDWTSYDKFLTYVIANITANGMTAGLDIDIWNEPDLGVFWNRSQDQWLQMWKRGYARLRTTFQGKGVLLVGPSLSGQPYSGNTWWTGYLSYVASNNVIPDQYTWHTEGNPDDINDDPQQASINLKALLQTYNLPLKQFNTNEYAIPAEQQPAGAAWFISRLERNNVIGLRGNWASQGELHDYLANLLGKPGAGTSSYQITGTGYWPNGEYQVYKYYATNMTGNRVATTGAGDNKFDVYATSTGTTTGVKILCGSRLRTGMWWITVNDMTAVGRPSSGTVNIRTWRFEFTGGTYGNVAAPVDLGIAPHDYSGNSVTFWVSPDNQNTAYAFEFV